MTGTEASKLANEYRNTTPQRATEILDILKCAGWKTLARLLEAEG